MRAGRHVLIACLITAQFLLSAQPPFVRNDVLVGDPAVSYGSVEFTPDFQYMVWGEFAADGTDNMVMWHCGVDPDTGDLIPWDGKGFRAFESTGWGRANSPGRDALGTYYSGLNRLGQIVLVRPTGPTSGTVEILPVPADISRRGLYGVDLPADHPGLGYVFWISNSEGIIAGPGDPRVSRVRLQYVSLANPSVVVTLQDQARPPVPNAFAPLDIAFPRNLRGTSRLTSGVRLDGVIQIVDFNLTDPAPPLQRLVTNDPVTKSDAFGWRFGAQEVLMSGTDFTSGITQIYTRPSGAQYFTPVEIITPQVGTLEPPVFAQSNEHLVFEGLGYTVFQVNSSTATFFGTTFQQKGEIWLASVLQNPQRQWRLSEDSDTAKFEPEPFVGRDRAWVFYSACPEGSELRSTTINLRRADTPLRTLTASVGSEWRDY